MLGCEPCLHQVRVKQNRIPRPPLDVPCGAIVRDLRKARVLIADGVPGEPIEQLFPRCLQHEVDDGQVVRVCHDDDPGDATLPRFGQASLEDTLGVDVVRCRFELADSDGAVEAVCIDIIRCLTFPLQSECGADSRESFTLPDFFSAPHNRVV